MTTNTSNGRVPRKTLASQLDRLDGIIDTLAEGLNGAVVDAVRDAVGDAVRQAVEQVLREVLANPQLLRHLLGQSGPASPPAPDEPAAPTPKQTCTKVKGALGVGWHWLRDRTKIAYQYVATNARALPGKIRDGFKQPCVAERLRGLRRTAAKAWELRGPLSLSLAAGVAAGLLGYLCGPAASAFALGACTSGITLAAILAAPLVGLWKAFKAQPA